jgi:hypothetical protein
VGGNLYTVGGRPRAALASIDLTTGRVTHWHPRVDGTVRTMSIAHGVLYVGGDFRSIAGRQQFGLAAFSARTGRLLPFSAEVTAPVAALTAAGRRLYIAGNFSSPLTGEPSSLAVLDARSGSTVPWGATVSGSAGFEQLGDTDGSVLRILVSKRVVYLAGAFTRVDGAKRPLLAAVRRRDGSLLPWRAHVHGRAVIDMALGGSRLYLTGEFSRIGRAARANFGAVSTTSGRRMPSATAVPDRGFSLLASGGDVFGGGEGWVGLLAG